jgi:hypothetical protein
MAMQPTSPGCAGMPSDGDTPSKASQAHSTIAANHASHDAQHHQNPGENAANSSSTQTVPASKG